ncbi:unannotated protein [freshwater metagenome]|uniref:Unannotated protein n=1 Tax=freshwater metagenome TaxID=449393 RepID=A0A6J6MUR3_9ZZZZ
MQAHQVLNRLNDVFKRQHTLRQWKIKTKLLVDLVAANLGKVVTLWIEVEIVEQVSRVFQCRRFARAQLAVDVQKCIFLASDVILLKSCHEGFVLTETLNNLFSGHAQSLQQHGDWLLTLAVNANCDEIIFINFKLKPCATAWNDLGCEDVFVSCLVDRAIEVHAW